MNIALLLIGIGAGTFVSGVIYLWVIHQVGKSSVRDRNRVIDQTQELIEARNKTNQTLERLADALEEILRDAK